MAKREIRAVTASADVAAVIDHGSDIDTQIKYLSIEDKGIKEKITEAAQNQLDEGELSVRLLGKTAAVVVSGVEKVELDASAEQFPQVRVAIDKGLLMAYVDRTVSLMVSPGDVERSAVELRKLGINAVVTENLKVSSDALRTVSETRSTNLEVAEAEKVLMKCVKRDVLFRIKYEKV